MNERFKFRVWDSVDCEYIEDSDAIRLTQYGKFVFNNAANNTEPELNHKRFIFEQCTGLEDKNRKLIYDGDILQDCEQKIIVVFDEENHCFMFKYKKTHAYKPICCLDVLDGDFEVIGNIHENSDLVEV